MSRNLEARITAVIARELRSEKLMRETAQCAREAYEKTIRDTLEAQRVLETARGLEAQAESHKANICSLRAALVSLAKVSEFAQKN